MSVCNERVQWRELARFWPGFVYTSEPNRTVSARSITRSITVPGWHGSARYRYVYTTEPKRAEAAAQV